MPRRTFPRALAVTAVAAATLLAACADSDPAADAPASSSTSLAATSSSATPTTPPETTTTIAATTTTTIPLEMEVEEALAFFDEQYVICGQNPAECDPSVFLAEEGSSLQNSIDGFRAMVERGFYFDADLRGSYRVLVEVIERPGFVTAVTCYFDAGVVLGPDGPDGLPTVINDLTESKIVEFDLYRTAGQLRVGSERVVTRLGSGDRCA